MAVTPLVSPLTSTGVVRLRRRAVAQLAIVVLSPALDAAAGGQRAGVMPAGSDGVTPLVSPLTSTGVMRLVVVPSPSWP